jgi:glycosyltransferase involved in cell wall biosynthesis
LWDQSTAIAAKTARATGTPYVVSAHGMLEPWALANKRWKKLLYSHLVERSNVARASCLHALTHAEASHYLRFGAQSPIAVIPNGVDIPHLKNPHLFLGRYPQLQGKRTILFLARLHPKKGLDLLIGAWSSIAHDYPDARLVVAGPDSEDTQQRLEQSLINEGVRDSVLFTGMLQSAMKWSALTAAECFVLPSFSEGLSVSVLEALGMGLPVIITEPCNMPEVRNACAGWVIQPNQKELVGALRGMLDQSPMENLQVGCRGAALIESRFTWPHVAKQMSDIYQWIQGGSLPKTLEMVFP